jgi:hypothetical protein
LRQPLPAPTRIFTAIFTFFPLRLTVPASKRPNTKTTKRTDVTTTVSAYAAPSATEPLAKTTIERRDP